MFWLSLSANTGIFFMLETYLILVLFKFCSEDKCSLISCLALGALFGLEDILTNSSGLLLIANLTAIYLSYITQSQLNPISKLHPVLTALSFIITKLAFLLLIFRVTADILPHVSSLFLLNPLSVVLLYLILDNR